MKRDNIRDFIQKGNEVHNSLYLYDNVIYVNKSTKVKIICIEHGIFEQTPKLHLNGSLCPKCSNRMSEIFK
mgnify:CR=1 FL=1